jgi:hypothetical protein
MVKCIYQRNLKINVIMHAGIQVIAIMGSWNKIQKRLYLNIASRK